MRLALGLSALSFAGTAAAVALAAGAANFTLVIGLFSLAVLAGFVAINLPRDA